PASSRLFLQFKEAGEKLYLGLSREYTEGGNPAGTSSYSFQIRRASDNAVVHGPFNRNSFVENLSSWEDTNGNGQCTDDAGDEDDGDCVELFPPACAITATVFNIVCDPGATASDSTDDTFTFTVVLDGFNLGTTWQTTSGATGAYGSSVTFGPYAIADGEVVLNFNDSDQAGCSASVAVPPPGCSNSCLLIATVLSVDCQDQGTPEDGTDDTFVYTLRVDANNAMGTWVASDGTSGNYGQVVESVGHSYAEGNLSLMVTDSEGLCTTTFSVNPPMPALLCPPDTDQRAFRGSVQILRGELNEQDVVLPEAPCFLALTSTPMSIGDRFMQGVDVLTPDDVDTLENVYNFFLFSEIALPSDLATVGNADGAGMLFRGDYTGYTDPCCFSMNYSSSLGDDAGLTIENPYVDTTGMFTQDMVLVQKFTHSLKMGQPFSLVTTTYGAGTTGKFAWVIVTEEEDSLAVLSTGITSEFRPNQDLRSDLTYLNLFWTQDNPASLAFLGEAIVEPYCGVDRLSFSDQLDFNDNCNEAYINRTFTLGFGNQIDSCAQQIIFRRPEFNDIVLPPATVTLQCGDDYGLDIEGYPHPDDTGYPLLDTGSEYMAMDRNTPFFNLQSSYKNFPDTTNNDMVLDFTREWTITDVCTGDTLYVILQRIKIGDFFPPTLSCSLSNHYCPIIQQDIMLFATDLLSCTATVVVPMPELRGFCDESCADEWTITTEIIRVTDEEIVATLEQDESRSVSNLERGDYFLHYLAEDGTGQRVEQTCRMRVADLQVPTAICRNRLTINLDTNAPFAILPGQIDLGSNDNCDTPELLLRRYYEAGTADCSGTATGFGAWQESIGFSCCDVGQTFLVELRVMDADSNRNGCTTLIDIGDQTAPVLSGLTTQVLPCATLPANFDPADSLQLVAQFGQPVATDNCQVSVVELSPELSWNNCELGSILRKFVATDTYGNTTAVPYEQLITVGNNDSYGIRLPKDLTTDCLDGLEELQFMAPGCGNFTVEYEDVDLDPAGAGCLRIQRTYRLVNTCTYDGVSAPVVISRSEDCTAAAGASYTWLVVDNGAAFIDADSLATNPLPPATSCGNPAGYWRSLPNVGAWEYTQIIELNDNTPPSLTYRLPTPVCTVDNSCEAPVNLAVTIGEECLPGRTPVRLFLDADNDGTVDADLSATTVLGGTWPNYQINGRFPIGNHAFVFQAEDACGNTASERIPFAVADCFIEQPLCDIGLEVQLVPVVPVIDVDGDGDLDEAAVVLSAALLAEMAGLDCSGSYRFSVNKPGQTPNFGNTSLILTCEDRYTATREIVVRDQAYNPLALQPDGSMGGPNYRHCTLQLFLQDSLQVCTSCAVSELEIEGVIRDRRLQPISEVMVELLVNEVPGEQTFTTLDGKFEFSNLAFSTNYEVRPFKNDDVRNGISALDLILLQRHLLLQTVIANPYTLLAADINRDGQVTTLDLLFMQALLLDRIQVFPNNTSWRFVPSAYPLTDIAADMPDSYNYYNLINCQFGQDFIGVKIGDLNGSASANGSLTGYENGGRGPWPLRVDDQELREGASYQIPVRASDLAQWSGAELTLAFEQQQVEVLKIEPGILTAGDLNTTNLNRGILKAVWAAGTIPVAAQQQPLFTLVVRAKANNQLSKVLHLSEQVVSVAYDQGLTAHELILEFRTGPTKLLLLANKPDPFHTETYVEFYLSQAGEYLLEVNDINGKLLQRRQAVVPAGAQQVIVDGSQLPAGVLFYKLTFAGQSVTRRMVKF
ncbi:MAG: hypothetical protein C7N36_18090, partial [Bacteroidetes bacterium]